MDKDTSIITLQAFLKSLINHQLFKILPMKEDNNKFLNEYLDSLQIELLGAKKNFQMLESDIKYTRIINTVAFLHKNDYSVKQCKREVFKMIHLAKDIYDRLQGGDNVE